MDAPHFMPQSRVLHFSVSQNDLWEGMLLFKGLSVLQRLEGLACKVLKGFACDALKAKHTSGSCPAAHASALGSKVCCLASPAQIDLFSELWQSSKARFACR